VARRTGSGTHDECHATTAVEIPDGRARLVDLVPAARPQDSGTHAGHADRAHDPRPGLRSARTAGTRVAAEEDVHAPDVPGGVEGGRIPDRVETVDRETGERATET